MSVADLVVHTVPNEVCVSDLIRNRWVSAESKVRVAIREGRLADALLIAETGVTGAPKHRQYTFRRLVDQINELIEQEEGK